MSKKPTKKNRKPSRRRTTKTIQIEARRKNVMGMLLQGYSPAHIRKSYEITPNTYRQDAKWIKKHLQTEIKLPDLEEAKAVLFEMHKMSVFQIWKIILKEATSEAIRVKALAELRHERIEFRKIMQAVGIIPTERITNIFAANEQHFVQNQNETKIINFHWGKPPEGQK